MYGREKVRGIVCMILLLMTASAFAQAPAIIKGKVWLETRQPAVGAVVSLVKWDGQKLLKTAIVDSAGQYVLMTTAKDSLRIQVSYVGHSIAGTAPFVLVNDQLEYVVNEIILQPGSGKSLENITVVARQNFVERKIDRTVINPDALISNAGGNALEVLEKSPGVQVDINGNISLQGKPGVMVFIDDKPTYMSNADLANYLRSLPSATIATIELMTNPPARYDAAGNAGIINIRLKKNTVKGINGGLSTSYGQGRYARSNNSVNLNYRVNKLNLFTNLSYNINNTFQDLFIDREYYKTGGALDAAFNQNSYIKGGSNGFNGKLGFDYYLDKKTTVGAVLSGFINNTLSSNTNRSVLTDGNGDLLRTVEALSRVDRTLKNGSVNLNMTRKLGSKGSEISFNGDYVAYNAHTDQSLVNNIYNPDGSFNSGTTLISNLPSTLDIWAGKIDYMKPVNNRGKFEAGVKSSYVSTTNVAAFYDLVMDSLVENNVFSNSFSYTENINAGYLNFSYNTKKMSVQAGLRVENTNITGDQAGNALVKDSSFNRHYTSVFPTLFLLYRLDSLAKNQLAFNLGRRINRPNYKDLNPFTYPLDLFTLYGGNPFLRPTFSHSLEMSHIFRNKYTTSLSVTYAKDVINETIQQEDGIFFSRPGNFGRQWAYGITFNGNFNLAKWWMLQVYSELMHSDFKSEIYGQQLDNEGTYWYLGPVNQFTINSKWSAELAGTYTTRVRVGQFITVPVWTLRAGVSMKVMKNKGAFKLNVNDIFYTNKPGGDIIAVSNSSASWHSLLDTRVATLTFTYRFSKGKALAARTSGSSEAEKGRVK